MYDVEFYQMICCTLSSYDERLQFEPQLGGNFLLCVDVLGWGALECTMRLRSISKTEGLVSPLQV